MIKLNTTTNPFCIFIFGYSKTMTDVKIITFMVKTNHDHVMSKMSWTYSLVQQELPVCQYYITYALFSLLFMWQHQH